MNEREDLPEMMKEGYCTGFPDYKALIIEMVQNIDEKTDNKFLIQIYTIIHRHIEKRGH